RAGAENGRSLERDEPPRHLVLEQDIRVDDVAASLDDVTRAPERIDVARVGETRVESPLAQQATDRLEDFWAVSGHRDDIPRSRPPEAAKRPLGERNAIEVDHRLRPVGREGPQALSLAGGEVD